jgi:hypothetical protein
MFHVDTRRQTWRSLVALRNFTNAPEKRIVYICYIWEDQFINSVGLYTVLCLLHKQRLNSKYVAILIMSRFSLIGGASPSPILAQSILYWHATYSFLYFMQSQIKHLQTLFCSCYPPPLTFCVGATGVTSCRHFEHRDGSASCSVSTSLFVQFITQHFKLWNENFLNTNWGQSCTFETLYYVTNML